MEENDDFIKRNREWYQRKKDNSQRVVVSEDMPCEISDKDTIPQTTIETLRDRLEEIL